MPLPVNDLNNLDLRCSGNEDSIHFRSIAFAVHGIGVILSVAGVWKGRSAVEILTGNGILLRID
jgi:hypothetical protein